MHVPQKMLLDWMTRHAPATRPPGRPKLLDVGCGSTGLAVGMAKAGYSGTLVDLDPQAGAAQNSRFQHANLSLPLFYPLDMGTQTLPGADYDYVTCAYCHQHIREEAHSRHFFAEVRRVLRPDGHLILADRITDRDRTETYWWERKGDPMWVRTIADLRALVTSCGLEIVAEDGFRYDFHTDTRLEPATWTDMDNAIVAIIKARRA